MVTKCKRYGLILLIASLSSCQPAIDKMQERSTQDMIHKCVLPYAVDDRFLAIFEKAKNNDADACFVLADSFAYVSTIGLSMDPPIDSNYLDICFELSDYWRLRAANLGSPEAILLSCEGELEKDVSFQDLQEQALSRLLSIKNPTDRQAEIIVRSVMYGKGMKEDPIKARELYDRFTEEGKILPKWERIDKIVSD